MPIVYPGKGFIVGIMHKKFCNRPVTSSTHDTSQSCAFICVTLALFVLLSPLFAITAEWDTFECDYSMQNQWMHNEMPFFIFHLSYNQYHISPWNGLLLCPLWCGDSYLMFVYVIDEVIVSGMWKFNDRFDHVKFVVCSAVVFFSSLSFIRTLSFPSFNPLCPSCLNLSMSVCGVSPRAIGFCTRHWQLQLLRLHSIAHAYNRTSHRLPIFYRQPKKHSFKKHQHPPLINTDTFFL